MSQDSEQKESSIQEQQQPGNDNIRKLRLYFGFGPDLTLLGCSTSLVGMTYMICGLFMFIVHWCTYSWTIGTLTLDCYGDRCWTSRKEKNVYSHTYNMLKYTDFLYSEPHMGIGFGIILICFGVLSALRFTRCVVNLGYIGNAAVLVSCVLLFPLGTLEYLLWSSVPKIENVDFFPLKLRAANDLALLLIVFGLSLFQMLITHPYIQYRSTGLITPLLQYIEVSRKPSKIWPAHKQSHHIKL
ncbi:uncharacterized protein DEA37_0009317 [Paragonimus westermani]|uniref:Uncharacterized protein n=1 Tax=Paragonimus westermani TaxID=34504 RepID=A0A5J4NNX4_9TREM|nr:uncharacterized protein DEA37_0009317 [Paragonimus westermani]